MFAAICATIDSAIAPGRKLVSHRRSQNDLAIIGIDGDLRDASAGGQTGIVPVFRSVARRPDAVAIRSSVSRKTLTRSNQDALRVARIDRNRADRFGLTAFERGCKRKAAVFGFPQSA